MKKIKGLAHDRGRQTQNSAQNEVAWTKSTVTTAIQNTATAIGNTNDATGHFDAS